MNKYKLELNGTSLNKCISTFLYLFIYLYLYLCVHTYLFIYLCVTFTWYIYILYIIMMYILYIYIFCIYVYIFAIHSKYIYIYAEYIYSIYTSLICSRGSVPGAWLGSRGSVRLAGLGWRGSARYLSSDTLMTPSSLGMITAALTTSWNASILLSRPGFRACGRGWTSAAMSRWSSSNLPSTSPASPPVRRHSYGAASRLSAVLWRPSQLTSHAPPTQDKALPVCKLRLPVERFAVTFS